MVFFVVFLQIYFIFLCNRKTKPASSSGINIICLVSNKNQKTRMRPHYHSHRWNGPGAQDSYQPYMSPPTGKDHGIHMQSNFSGLERMTHRDAAVRRRHDMQCSRMMHAGTNYGKDRTAEFASDSNETTPFEETTRGFVHKSHGQRWDPRKATESNVTPLRLQSGHRGKGVVPGDSGFQNTRMACHSFDSDATTIEACSSGPLLSADNVPQSYSSIAYLSGSGCRGCRR